MPSGKSSKRMLVHRPKPPASGALATKALPSSTLRRVHRLAGPKLSAIGTGQRHLKELVLECMLRRITLVGVGLVIPHATITSRHNQFSAILSRGNQASS
eukprot:scaffold1425_cov333-Prasinococcus_capsulatus_cf.AAC.10